MVSPDRMFYVYEHWRLDKNECFYVGKGTRDRAYSQGRRNIHWKNIVAKLERTGSSYEVRIVADGLTEKEALDLEKKRIALWRDTFDLANMTDGGEGVSGYKHSLETRKKLSINNGMRSTEARTKVSKANKGKTIPPEARAKIAPANKGKIMSAEAKAKLSKALRNRSPETRAKLSESARKAAINRRRARKS